MNDLTEALVFPRKALNAAARGVPHPGDLWRITRGYIQQITQRAYIADYELVSGGTGFSIIEVADPVVRTNLEGVSLDVHVKRVEMIARRRALRRNTGQDFGTDQDRWRTWFDEHGGEGRVAWLIESLDHDDPEIRAIASRDLTRIAAQDFGYQVNMPPDERRAIRERFRMWHSNRTHAGE